MNKRILMSVIVLSAVLSANAADVRYTGEGAAGDLSDAANWGGSLPGQADIGVVDVSAHGSMFTLSQDASLGGIRFNGNVSPVTIESARTLTLGAGGLSVGSTGGVTFKLPMAVSAASVWDFGSGPAKFHDTISGSAQLTITHAKGIWHYKSPRYGGKLNYVDNYKWNDSSYGKETLINFYEPGAPWADTVGIWKFSLFFQGETSFKTLFPGMSRVYDWWTVWMGRVGNEGGAGGAGLPTLKIGDGENVFIDRLINGGGTVAQTGGTMEFDNASSSLILGNMHMYDYVWDAPCLYRLDGGVFKAKDVWIGERAKGEADFTQRGGTALFSKQLAVGCGDATDQECLAGYQLEGGALTVRGATSGDGGLILSCARGTAGSGRGFMRVGGGTAEVDRVMFGGNEAADLDSVDTYGLFQLDGGTLNLGAGGFVAGSKWNPADSRSWDKMTFADVRLDSGVVSAVADSFSSLPLKLSKPGSSLEVAVPENRTMSVFAPVSGEGTVVKSGEGTLVLTDANNFEGELEIREGKVRLLAGTVEGLAGPVDCWQWTADSLVEAGVADGAAVSSWSDIRHGVTAVNGLLAGQTTAFASPVLKKSVFNGHAALAFNSAMLRVPADANPLVDAKALTIALVFRMDNEATASLTGHRFYSYGTHMMNGTDGVFNRGWAPWFNWVAGNRVQFTVDSGYETMEAHRVTSSKGSLKDEVHVCVATVDDKQIVLTTEGETVRIPWSGEFKNLYRYRDGNAPLPILIGAVSSEPGCNYTISGMNIAEFRLYSRALMDEERAALASELSLRYNGSKKLALSCWSGTDEALTGETSVRTDPVVGTVPTAFRSWAADAITLEDGAEVLAWSAAENAQDALTVPQGLSAPQLVKNALNGHAAVRFDAQDKTALSLPLPGTDWLPDWNNWTVAVVFRTTQGGVGLKGVTDGNGIVSVAKDETVVNSFQISMVTNGEVKTVSSCKVSACRRPLALDDGRPHVVLMTSDVFGRCFAWNSSKHRIVNIDGIYNVVGLDRNPEIGNGSGFALNLGRIVGEKGLFSGEIMEVRLYSVKSGGSLSVDQMNAVVRELAEKYSVGLHLQEDYGYGCDLACGLGASNVTIAAGASLVLPSAEERPFTVGAGQCIDVRGGVFGTLALADGAKLRVDRSLAETASIEKLMIPAGTVYVDVVGDGGALPVWQPLLKCGAAEIDSRVKVRVIGVDEGKGVFEYKDGVLGLRLTRGLFIKVY